MKLPGELIILGTIIIALFTVIVGVTEFTAPVFDRSKFDDTCNKGLAIVERTGKLTENDKDKIEKELNRLGFIDINITAPDHTDWGQEATLVVIADYEFEVTTGDGSKKIITETAKYENSTIVMCFD